MHELGITQEIVMIAAEKAGRRKVRRVVVEIGRLTAVLPDAVRFCFDVCAEGTPVAGAELEIVEIAGRARCKACRIEQRLERPFGICACGHTDFDWLAGEELRVKTVEVH
jgi:hydrogenase nickel incorporation protein HypA/HybF